MNSASICNSKDICTNIQKIPFVIACRNAGLNDVQIRPLLDDPRNANFITDGYVDKAVETSEYYLKGCDNLFRDIHKTDLLSKSRKIPQICDIEKKLHDLAQRSADTKKDTSSNPRVKDPYMEEVNKSIYGDEYKQFDPKSKSFHKLAEDYCLYGIYANNEKVDDAIFDTKTVYIYPNDTPNKVFSQYHIEKLNEIIRQNEIANRLMFENHSLKLNENKKFLQRSTSEPPPQAFEASQIITSKVTSANINLKSVNMKMQYIMQPPFHPHDSPRYVPMLQGSQLQFSMPIYQQSAIAYYPPFQQNRVLRPFDSITSLSVDASITTATSTKTKVEKNSKEAKKLYSKIGYP